MKISIIQSDIIWENRFSNFENLEKLISPLFNKIDIIVLPEMFNTGFSMNPEKLSEPPQGETFEWMKDLAQKGNFGLCGSYMVKENMSFFNRWLFVTPGKESWKYDKRHLFSMGGEDKMFSSGRNRLILSFRGVRISAGICYDLRFPVWSRNRNDYDLLIYSANWPEARKEVWNILLKARAIENQCYVAGANRIGTDGKGIKYCGESIIIDPGGKIITTSHKNKEESISGEISMAELSDFRKKFPVFKDADDFLIKI
jgi:omega-amidase